MNNKKLTMINKIIILLLTILLIFLYYYLMIFNDKRVKLSVYEAGNFTSYTGELPEFKIQISGIVSGNIDKKILDVNNVKPYSFEARINDGWNEYTNEYVGYKMKDFLSILKNNNYKSITAYNAGGIKTSYSLDLINQDSLFIVFYKDGKEIFDKNIALISIKEGSQYYVENLIEIGINDMEAK